MDWPRARLILLAAFMIVNLVLGYSLWGPSGILPELSAASDPQEIDRVRKTLLERNLELPTSVTVPRTPPPMRFLHVDYRALTPDPSLKGSVDPATRSAIYEPKAEGPAAREVKLDSRSAVQQAAEEYLRHVGLMPKGTTLALSRLANGAGERALVEFVPVFDGYPVYSGYVRVELSARGIERVIYLWIEPKGYTEAPPRVVRPAPEALLRLAGRLEPSRKPRVITELRLGYYAGRSLTDSPPDAINGWDTVPVWRITLDSGEVFHINALNGEWEP